MINLFHFIGVFFLQNVIHACRQPQSEHNENQTQFSRLIPASGNPDHCSNSSFFSFSLSISICLGALD
jgi:hypothetical protein